MLDTPFLTYHQNVYTKRVSFIVIRIHKFVVNIKTENNDSLHYVQIIMMMMQFGPLARQRSLQTLNALVIPILEYFALKNKVC